MSGEADVTTIAHEIVSLRPRVERAIETLKAQLDRVSASLDGVTIWASAEHWRLVAFTDGMIKVRLIIEQNFHFLETFGVLATTRYMLELLIWFRLLAHDSDQYGFIYAKQLITDKIDHSKEHLAKVRQEIKLFESLQIRENAEADRVIGEHREKEPDQLGSAMRLAAAAVDRDARRNFSLYSKDAKHRGYGYQAALMREQVIPKLEREIEDLQESKNEAISQMPTSAQRHRPWRWKDMALAAGMIEQFDFVYAYTSRLLHATPTSLTTNQKNLEVSEIAMFLDFLYVSMLDAIDLSEKVVAIQTPP